VLDKPDAFNWLPRTARQDRDRLRAELDHERQERERLVRVIEEQAAAVRSQGEQIRLLTDQREQGLDAEPEPAGRGGQVDAVLLAVHPCPAAVLPFDDAGSLPQASALQGYFING
jgi:hypothetical protein